MAVKLERPFAFFRSSRSSSGSEGGKTLSLSGFCLMICEIIEMSSEGGKDHQAESLHRRSFRTVQRTISTGATNRSQRITLKGSEIFISRIVGFKHHQDTFANCRLRISKKAFACSVHDLTKPVAVNV